MIRVYGSLILLVSTCFALAGCISADTSNSANSGYAANQSPALLDPQIVSWLSTCQSNGQDPTVEGLLKQSTSVKSIRDQVKEKYGDLKAASFVQYFASPEFTGMATKALARPVVVQVVAGADEAKSKLYSPGSLLVYADGHDLAEYGYVNIGPEGKALDGGAGVDHIQQ